MRTFSYLAFCAAVVLGFGCITDYPLITDNDQDRGNGGSLGGGTNGNIVNTNGKAQIKPVFKSALIWPDGTDELMNFVDQQPSGDQTITTYNNYDAGGDGATFHSDLYCSPDWQGCSIWTSQNPNDPSDDPFDGVGNENCFGFRSLSVLITSGRYYGECGRARLSLEDRLRLMSEGVLQARFGREGLLYRLAPDNFSITLDNGAGVVTALPLRGTAEAWLAGDNSNRNKGVLELTNPLLGTVMRGYASWLGTHGRDETTATLCYQGVCTDFFIAGNRGPSTPSRINANANRHF